MTISHTIPCLIAALVLWTTPLLAAKDDPFRCGSDIITLGDMFRALGITPVDRAFSWQYA